MALALAACQSAPAERQPAAVEPAPGPVAPQPGLAPAGSAIMDQSVTITPPAKGVPAKYAAFSGIWAGRLEGTSEAEVAVQTISPNGQVTVTFAWSNLGDNNPGEAAGAGRIVGTTLKLGRLPNGADISLTMLPGGTLAGTYVLAGQTYTGTFSRQ
ncbi:hypothetical protein [Mesorhizobium erdmanii]|uniref:hypothetical protein n=1 Tax=Mesorhizobium erdmanii TaxID=1777866 RepID=UPI001FD7C607|nr:hypothetical protein [Mesorhizobium erdmanii]